MVLNTMLVNRNYLQRILKSLGGFDPSGSPYIAVELAERPLFYRSGSLGFIQSKEFTWKSHVNVSLSHFQESLRVLTDDSLDISLDKSGVLLLTTDDAAFSSQLRVHTVQSPQAGHKNHQIGSIVHRMSPAAFAGLDLKSFKLASPPYISKGKIMVSTASGLLMWESPSAELKTITMQLRESFLRLILTQSALVKEVVISDKGYWGVVLDDLVGFLASHNVGKEMFQTYDVQGTELARFPAVRLVYALRAAAGLCEDTSKIQFDPKQGVVTRDKFGNESTFSLGGVSGWTRFGIFGKTTKFIVDCISQSEDEEAVLYSVPSNTHPTMRITRGNFEVNIKAV